MKIIFTIILIKTTEKNDELQENTSMNTFDIDLDKNKKSYMIVKLSMI